MLSSKGKIVIRDSAAHYGLAVITFMSISCLLFIFFYIVHESYPLIIRPQKFLAFLFQESWEPFANPPQFGIIHAWLSSIILIVICLSISVPIGLGIALFLSEVAPGLLRSMVRPCLDVLSGIPSVVYGFFGYMTIVPWFEMLFGLPTGESLLAAAIVLSIMILPFMASTSADALQSVSSEIREAAMAQGVTHWYMVRRILLPLASPGLFAGVILSLTRAIGETMAVLMIAGNSVAIPSSPLDRGQPITALIATEIGEAGVSSDKYHALFASSLILVCFVVVINAITLILKKKMFSHAKNH